MSERHQRRIRITVIIRHTREPAQPLRWIFFATSYDAATPALMPRRRHTLDYAATYAPLRYGALYKYAGHREIYNTAVTMPAHIRCATLMPACYAMR